MTLSALLRRRPAAALFTIAVHVAGGATSEVYFDGRNAAEPTLTAVHRDPEGTWFEQIRATSLARAHTDEEFSAIAARLRFASGHPVAPNRFDGLVTAAAEWFA